MPTGTKDRLIAAAGELIAVGAAPTAAAVARRAGVSRLTVYHHFGSQPGLLAAVARESAAPPLEPAGGAAGDRLRSLIHGACAHWASSPALFRRLPGGPGQVDEQEIHALASALADADQLRPGCSLREAEDVIAVATSFAAFDRLHHDGRRSPAAVADILHRIAATVLA